MASQAQVDALKASIATLQSKLNATVTTVQTMQQTITDLTAQRDALQVQVNEAAIADQAITDAQTAVNAMSAQIDANIPPTATTTASPTTA